MRCWPREGAADGRRLVDHIGRDYTYALAVEGRIARAERPALHHVIFDSRPMEPS
jgi:hypothetical protein